MISAVWLREAGEGTASRELLLLLTNGIIGGNV